MPYHCLSVCQPYAWAILHAGKNVENRPWHTEHRGPLLIHAGRSTEYMDRGMGDMRRITTCPRAPAEDELAFGAIVGIVELLDCAHILRGGHEGRFLRNPWAEGSYCWVLVRPRSFREPIPWPGKLGLFGVPTRIVAAAIAAAEPGPRSCRWCAWTDKSPGPRPIIREWVEPDLCSECGGEGIEPAAGATAVARENR